MRQHPSFSIINRKILELLLFFLAGGINCAFAHSTSSLIDKYDRINTNVYPDA